MEELSKGSRNLFVSYLSLFLKAMKLGRRLAKQESADREIIDRALKTAAAKKEAIALAEAEAAYPDDFEEEGVLDDFVDIDCLYYPYILC